MHAWAVIVATAAFIALLLGLWTSARTLGLLNQPKHWLRSTYMPPFDLIGSFSLPMFMIEFENRGNVPIVFSDFVLMQPRIEGSVDAQGRFVRHTGAEVYVDAERRTRGLAYQLVRKVEYLTKKVRVEPGEMHTEFIDFATFFPDVHGGRASHGEVRLPNDWQPILSFHDNYGNNYYCDEQGLHRGTWEHPYIDALRAVAATLGFGSGIETRRAWWRWSWRERRTPGLGEAPELARPE